MAAPQEYKKTRINPRIQEYLNRSSEVGLSTDLRARGDERVDERLDLRVRRLVAVGGGEPTQREPAQLGHVVRNLSTDQG